MADLGQLLAVWFYHGCRVAVVASVVPTLWRWMVRRSFMLPIVVSVLSGIRLSLVLLLIDILVVVAIFCVNFADCQCHFHNATVVSCVLQ